MKYFNFLVILYIFHNAPIFTDGKPILWYVCAPECSKIYRRYVLHLPKYTENLKADAVQVCGTFLDTQYININRLVSDSLLSALKVSGYPLCFVEYNCTTTLDEYMYNE